ncbi:MAG: phosphoadenosine phosphosulfate reductase family protein [Candidatus Hadarchaeales archaeon]
MLKPREFVDRYQVEKVVCCFSGGRDSLVSTHFMLEDLNGLPVEKYVVWVDTTITLPSVRKFVRETAEELGWPLVELKPDATFEEYALRFGMPTMFRRWCCYYLKLRPIFKFIKEISPDGGVVGEVVGIRRDESRRRRNYPQVSRRPHSLLYCPILDWTQEDVEKYMERNGLPTPPWYGWGIKETCQCGAFASTRSLKEVCKRYPSFFRRFLELEKKFRSGGSAFFLDGRPYYAREIWEEVWNGRKRRRG